MLEVPEKYRTMAKSDAREVSVKVVIGSVELTNDDIIELNIYRSLGENGFGIGGTVTTRVRLLCIMTLPYTGTVSLEVYVRFGFDDKTSSDYVQLGRFYGQVSNPIKKNNQIEIIGYDKLGSSGLSARCTFATWGDASLTFPCTAQEMLEYFCARKNIETEIICNDYDIPEMPVKDKTKDIADYERYYTYGEIISFIAAAHGANAAIDNSGKLVFLSAKQSEEQVNASDCIDFSLTTAEQFTVKGILLHVQDTLSTGSTNIFINDDSKKAYDGEIYEGVAEASCCFGSIEIAEALWGQLGGFAYTSCEFTRRGCGWTELGDVISATDDMRVNVYGKNVSRDIMVQTVEWSFSAANGFTEHIISKADNSEESAERLGSNNTINYSGGGVGEFTDAAKTSEIFNSYKDVKNEGGIVSKKNYINEKTQFAHASGVNNSIDKDEQGGSLKIFSDTSSILGGTDNYITGAQQSTVVNGNNNKILKGGIGSVIAAGAGNTVSCAISAIIAGNGNTIENDIAAFIGGGQGNIVKSALSAILAGQSNIIENGFTAFIGGGQGNIVKSALSAILAGQSNTIADNSQNSTILAGKENKILGGTYSAILAGQSNTIGGNANTILAGYGNKILGGSCNAILAGQSNTIDNSSQNSTILAGEGNSVVHCSHCAVLGQNNTVKYGNNSIVIGWNNNLNRVGAMGIIIGRDMSLNSPTFLNNAVIVVGAGSSVNCYIDLQGNIYAKSFNVIGSETAVSPAFESSKTMAAETVDISALARQVSQMQSEIEALKSEIEQLKGAAS